MYGLSCLVVSALCDPMDSRILEWVAISFSRFSWPRIKPGSPVSPVLQADSLPAEPLGQINLSHLLWEVSSYDLCELLLLFFSHKYSEVWLPPFLFLSFIPPSYIQGAERGTQEAWVAPILHNPPPPRPHKSPVFKPGPWLPPGRSTLSPWNKPPDKSGSVSLRPWTGCTSWTR